MLDMDLKRNVLYNFIKDRISRNKNCIIIINGETGSGKTYVGLRTAIDLSQMFGTEFSVEKNMDFNFAELLKKMYLPGNEKPGSVFLFEEVGSVDSGADSQEWQKKQNQFFSSFMQTSRHRRQILIMTCPMFTNLQKKTRELCHMVWAMCGINPTNNLSSVKPLRIQVNETSGKMYMKYLRFKTGGVSFKLNKVMFRLPPSEIITTYEAAKTNFTNLLNKKIIEYDLPKVKELTDRQKTYLEMYNEGIPLEEIARVMDIPKRMHYKYQEDIKKKGFEVIKRDIDRKTPFLPSKSGIIEHLALQKRASNLTFPA